MCVCVGGGGGGGGGGVYYYVCWCVCVSVVGYVYHMIGGMALCVHIRIRLVMLRYVSATLLNDCLAIH